MQIFPKINPCFEFLYKFNSNFCHWFLYLLNALRMILSLFLLALRHWIGSFFFFIFYFAYSCHIFRCLLLLQNLRLISRPLFVLFFLINEWVMSPCQILHIKCKLCFIQSFVFSDLFLSGAIKYPPCGRLILKYVKIEPTRE